MNNAVDIHAHAAALTERGYTIIPSQVEPQHIAALNAAADKALDKVSRAISEGVKPAHTQFNPHVRSARCFYTWGEASCLLLAHPTVHALGRAVLGQAKLWEMPVLEALPMPSNAELGPFDWHRDFSVGQQQDLRQAYLWIFTCLTDVTADNGATWVVPGSHRNAALQAPSAEIGNGHTTAAVQLTANAGDIVAINPVALHRVGENRTRRGRRLALIGLCRVDRRPLLNHWSIAGKTLRAHLPEPVRELLKSSDSTLDESWDVLPDGWTVAKTPPVERVLRSLVRRGAKAIGDPKLVLRRLQGNIRDR